VAVTVRLKAALFMASGNGCPRGRRLPACAKRGGRFVSAA
jgi:hypothetical protein